MIKYWICVCREENYPYEKEIYGEECQWWKFWGESERKYSVCFELMREGDKVLCYEAKTHIFKAVLEVKDKFENNQKMILSFERKVGVPLDTIISRFLNSITKTNMAKINTLHLMKAKIIYSLERILLQQKSNLSIFVHWYSFKILCSCYRIF